MLSRTTLTTLPALLLLMLGCGTPQPDGPEARTGGEEFAQFADRLYAELGAQPISPDRQTRIGLFGNLDVMSGENVVMGQYRYRVDTLDGRPTGHLAFHVRDEEAGRAVPVILTFHPSDGAWHLENSRYVEPPAPSVGASQDADTSDVLTRTLNVHLETWAEDAVARAHE